MSTARVDTHEESLDDADGPLPLDKPFIIGAEHLLRILDDHKTAVALAERCCSLMVQQADEIDRLRKELAALAEELLLQKMCEISEECYRAGWMDGLENSLWNILQARGGHYGQGIITGREAEHLKKLSDTCGGWWHFPKSADCPQFINLNEWKKLIGEG